MSVRRFLGLGGPAQDARAGTETATVRRIVDALERQEPGAARIARFAYVLGRVAHADHEVSADETRVMERLASR
jgi:tellurite resistance protein